MRRVGSAIILAACLLATACQPMKPAAVKTHACKPLAGKHLGARRARALKHKRPVDPERQRLLERARRWKEQQQEQLHRLPPYPSRIHADPDSRIT